MSILSLGLSTSVPKAPSHEQGKGRSAALARFVASSLPLAAYMAAAQGGGTVPADAPEPAPEVKTPSKAVVVTAAALTALTTFIPAETLTGFVAAAGVLQGWKTASDSQAPNFFAWYWVFFGVSIIFFVVAAVVGARDPDKRLSWGKLIFRLLAVPLAYTIWACAISFDTAAVLLQHAHLSPNPAHLRDILGLAVLLTSLVLTGLDSIIK